MEREDSAGEREGEATPLREECKRGEEAIEGLDVLREPRGWSGLEARKQWEYWVDGMIWKHLMAGMVWKHLIAGMVGMVGMVGMAWKD